MKDSDYDDEVYIHYGEKKTGNKCPFCKKELHIRPWNIHDKVRIQIGCRSRGCPCETGNFYFDTSAEALAFAENLGNTTRNNKHEK